jgi:AraC family transcriptional regulator
MVKNLQDDDYASRLERVDAYIRNHYAEDLNLEKLAAVACFSKFHFHRIFKSLQGETVNDHVKRIRLEEACRKLREDSNFSISEVAYSCGFANPQQFAKAFKARFGITPTQAREGAQGGPSFAKREQVEPPGIKDPLRVTVRELPSYRVAYIRHVGPPGPNFNSKSYSRLFGWAVDKGLTDISALVMRVNWSDRRKTPREEWIEDACLTVPEGIEGGGEVQIQSLVGGRFAVYHAQLPLYDIKFVQSWLTDEWLPANNYRNELGPSILIMYNNPHTNPLKLVVFDLCIPVEPL